MTLRRTCPTVPLIAFVIMTSAGCEATESQGGTEARADAVGMDADTSIPGLAALAQEPHASPIAPDEYRRRRDEIMSALPDGILLIHGRSAGKAMEQWGFVQDPTLLYYTGLAEAPAAILALDGVAREAHLFLPPTPQSFGLPAAGVMPEPGPATATSLGVASAQPWSDFQPWIRERLREGVAILYVDEARRPEATGMPPGMMRLHGERALWRDALVAAFPEASVESGADAIVRHRAVKSGAEIEILAQNARRTAAALVAVAHHLEPGARQRSTESAMVDACIEAGGQGPSFWPWTMSGPNAHVDQLAGAFFRYDQGDRVAQAGELVRVDIGCAGGLYGADVGRTLPVSGTFAPGQREAWDLLVLGYQAGLDAMADGVAIEDVRGASMRAVEAQSGSLRTEAGRAALSAMRSGGGSTWHVHGVGVESGEDLPDTLRSGMVLAYEPGVSVGADAYYLEDMIVVTDGGHRVLSQGLPYTAAEIEALMAR